MQCSAPAGVILAGALHFIRNKLLFGGKLGRFIFLFTVAATFYINFTSVIRQAFVPFTRLK
jgi:hypothetical protein